MNAKQSEDMVRNILDFKNEYTKKYTAGQKEHTGNLWEMGLKQAVGNAKEEVLDLWSYLMTIEKVIEKIENLEEAEYAGVTEILNHRKKD